MGSIIYGDLQPVGEKIIWRGRPRQLPTYQGFDSYWVDSGTAALALTIVAAKQLNPDIKKPEVIIPAYGCPDLVAAATYAKVQPVLVDICEQDAGYNLDKLQNAINKNTIAVIAVNFLGIAERLTAIKKLLPGNAYLIEDNAQSYQAIIDSTKIIGDFSITSFGRGKPISLLGGGLALINKNLAVQLELGKQIKQPQKTLTFKLKAALYNLLLNPHLYAIISRAPFLQLGVTRYKKINDIVALDANRAGLLSANIEHYRRGDRSNPKHYHLMIDALKGDDIKELGESARLRYPILCKTEQQRNLLLEKFNANGLGASAMYNAAMEDIEDIPDNLAQKENQNASSFSKRLITLPCHSRVTEKHRREILSIIKEIL